MAAYGPSLRRFALPLTCLSLMAFYSVYGHGHGHGDHGHSHEEPASFKYTREANTRQQDSHSHKDHGHSHEQVGHGHTHEHGGHGHTHEHGGHGHTHEHGGHSHEHDDHGHSHDHHDGHGHSHDHHGHSHEDQHGYADEDYGRAHGEHDHLKRDAETETVRGPKKTDGLMLRALGSTILISLAPVLLLLFIPLDRSPSYQPFLKTLLSFASGGLLGDAFLHLIPHAISPHGQGDEGHTHSHSHAESGGHDHSGETRVGLLVLMGIIAFLVVEKLMRLVNGSGGHGHSHGPSVKEEPAGKGKQVESTPKSSPGKDEKAGKGKEGTGKGSPGKDEQSGKGKQAESSAKDKKDEGKADSKCLHEKKHEEDQHERMKVAGYLNLAADFVHNFTDGLAIGASYLAGGSIGFVTTIAILVHEVPHELGDFAILVQAGCSKKKAMLLQMTTAIGAMLGTICSLMAETADGFATNWILPFTAGGFIYIATVSIIPELLENSNLWQSIKEIAALLVGISIMVLIGQIEQFWDLA